MGKGMSDLFARVEALRQSSAQRAEENRRRMPECTRFIDVVRQVFPGATVSFASENGVTLGTEFIATDTPASHVCKNCRHDIQASIYPTIWCFVANGYTEHHERCARWQTQE